MNENELEKNINSILETAMPKLAVGVCIGLVAVNPHYLLIALGVVAAIGAIWLVCKTFNTVFDWCLTITAKGYLKFFACFITFLAVFVTLTLNT